MRNRILAFLALGFAAGAPCFGALTSYNATLDMSMLQSGTFYLDFQMVDGDGVTNNTVNISNFTITTDTLMGGLILPLGGASGSLATGLTLPDNDAGMDGFSNAEQQFSHTGGGGSLSFTFSYDPSFAGVTPDLFTFTILDSAMHTIVNNPASNGGLIQIVFNSTSALPETFAADSGFGSIDPLLTESPEPASIVLTGAGAALLLLLAYRRGRVAPNRPH